MSPPWYSISHSLWQLFFLHPFHYLWLQSALHMSFGAELSKLVGMEWHAICRGLQAGALSNRRSRLEAGGLGLLGHAVWDFKRISIYSHQSTSPVIWMVVLTKQSPESFLICSSPSYIRLFVFHQHPTVPFINVHYLHQLVGETCLVLNIFQLLDFKAGPWLSLNSIITGAVNLHLLTYIHSRKRPPAADHHGRRRNQKGQALTHLKMASMLC